MYAEFHETQVVISHPDFTVFSFKDVSLEAVSSDFVTVEVTDLTASWLKEFSEGIVALSNYDASFIGLADDTAVASLFIVAVRESARHKIERASGAHSELMEGAL